jgi:hypothetical protein
MLIIDPPATAGGTDLFQVRVLTFEAQHRIERIHTRLGKNCGTKCLDERKSSFNNRGIANVLRTRLDSEYEGREVRRRTSV